MALRKAWARMKDTLPSHTRQFLVTSELWQIFLAKDQKDGSVIENLQMRRKEKILPRNGHEYSSKIEALNEKGYLRNSYQWMISILAYHFLLLQEKN